MTSSDGLKSAVSAEEWERIGMQLYGSEKRNWKFKCPNCGHIQTFNDFLKFVSEEEARGLIGFSCIGRVMPNCNGTMSNKEKPCNYTLGGLFNLAKFGIIEDSPKGKKEHPFFEFADPIPPTTKVVGILGAIL